MKRVVTNLVIAAALVVGCGKSPSPTDTQTTATASPATTAQAAVDGKEVFKARCAPCHGESGKGNGPGAVALNPKPRDYTDVAWQKKVSDEDIKKTILYGGAAVGKSPAMPANPDLDGKPEVDALVKVVRQFGG